MCVNSWGRIDGTTNQWPVIGRYNGSSGCCNFCLYFLIIQCNNFLYHDKGKTLYTIPPNLSCPIIDLLCLIVYIFILLSRYVGVVQMAFLERYHFIYLSIFFNSLFSPYFLPTQLFSLTTLKKFFYSYFYLVNSFF